MICAYLSGSIPEADLQPIIEFYNMRITSNMKKNLLIVLMMFVPVWFIILKRRELFESSGYFRDQTSERRTVWEECARRSGNSTDSIELLRENKSRSVSNESVANVSEDEVYIELKHIKKSLNNIFFVESKCATEKLTSNAGDFTLNRRQCCAVESTSRTNPQMDVFILHTCPLTPGYLRRAPLYVRRVMSRPNVHLVRLVWLVIDISNDFVDNRT